MLDLWAVLFPMRFSVVVLILGSILLMFVYQSQDALYVIVADAAAGSPMGWLRLTIFVAGSVFWAFSSFYAGRLMSRLKPRGREQMINTLAQNERRTMYIYPPPVLHEQWLKQLNLQLPRWLGYLVIISVTLSVVKASWRLNSLVLTVIVLVSVVVLWIFHWFMVRRRAIVSAVGSRTTLGGLAVNPELERDLDVVVALPGMWRAVPGVLIMLILVLCFASAFYDLRLEWTIISLITLVFLAVGLAALYATSGFPAATKWMVTVQVLLLAMLFLFSASPALPPVANAMGAPAIVVLAAAGWAFAGTFFFALPAHMTQPRVLSFLILLSLGFSLLGNPTTTIYALSRRTPSPNPDSAQAVTSPCAPLSTASLIGAPAPSDKAKLDAFAMAFARWCSVAAKYHSGTGPIPLVIVATAGGASRAAYWTEKVLAELEARVPHFHDHVFAISSVSGGTLGAAAYRLSLDLPWAGKSMDGPASGTSCTDAKDQNPTNCVLAMLQRDFLSSLLMGGLYSDLVQRFLPGAVLPDRASALERSWDTPGQATSRAKGKHLWRRASAPEPMRSSQPKIPGGRCYCSTGRPY